MFCRCGCGLDSYRVMNYVWGINKNKVLYKVILKQLIELKSLTVPILACIITEPRHETCDHKL